MQHCEDMDTYDALHWMPELEMGWYPVQSTGTVYNREYFAKYQRYAATPMGKALTQARVDFVARHYQGELTDVGIGSGQFVEARPQTFGTDINRVAIDWLATRGLNKPLWYGCIAASFWDSLEHCESPTSELELVKRWAFISMPIYRSMEHVLASKHYRRDEHFWFWTQRGFERWAKEQGFAVREVSDMETQLGREDILSFALERT